MWAKEIQTSGRLTKGKTLEGINYCINQEEALKVFLDDGEVPLDNNATEGSLRSLCLHKHAWKLIDSIDGAQSSAIIYSITETAKANNLNPFRYLKYILTVMKEHQEDTDYRFMEELLPWSEQLPDLEGMTAINLEEDVSRGVENNYSLKILEKKIANAKSGTNKTSLEQSLKSQKETAASSIKNAYESMMISKSDYEQALNTYEIEAAAMAAAERKMAAGTTTRNDYVTQQTAFAAAQVNVRTQKLALLKAQLEYRWSVDGLASVS